ASLKPDENGMRGAVLLEKARYQIDGALKITASGVILRGSETRADGTTLFAAGTDRRTLIRIVGGDDRKIDSAATPITQDYTPVSATRLPLRGNPHFKPGDTVIVKRPCTAEWIKTLGMDNMGGER